MMQSWLLTLAIGVQIFGAPTLKVDAVPAPEWERLFLSERGWIGSDCAYSVPLNRQRVLWLFGDTWVGEICGGKRINAFMVIGNTIAVQEGLDPRSAKVRFVFGPESDGKQTAFVKPPFAMAPSDIGFWFGHGTAVGGRLCLFMSYIKRTEKGGVFGFRTDSSWLAEVSNAAEPPEQWRFTFHQVPFFLSGPERHVSYGAALLREGRWVYIYGVAEDPQTGPLNRGLLVARAPANHLSNFAAWMFLHNGRWIKDWKAALPLPVRDIGTEFSVSYLSALHRYVLVYSPSDLAPVIKVRWADKPTGPWSDAFIAYRCPDAEIGREVFCYAAKGHPELSSGNELLVTYATNSFQLKEVLENSRLYFPRFVRLRFSAP